MSDAQFNLAVEKSTMEVYEQGPFAKLGGGPEAVAKLMSDRLPPRVRRFATK